MRFPMIAEVHAYWEALRNGRSVPMRSEVDPRGIERALENAFILERVAPGVARFRLAGTHLNELMGMDVRGMPLSAFFTPGVRDALGKVLDAMFGQPEIVDLTLSGERGIGKPLMEARLLMLPLKSDLGVVNRALGCLASIGPIGRAPRRFDITLIKTTSIWSETKPVRSETRYPSAPIAVPQEPQVGFSEAPAGFTQAPGTRPVVKGRPALRLVKSDD